MRCAHSSTDRRTRHKVALGGVPTGFGLGADPIRTLRTAALLRDIGKVGVPDEIVSKADALDESESEVMRQHPVIGERIIGAIPGMGAVARIVRHGHERWDGNGYPDGLAGSEIRLRLASSPSDFVSSTRVSAFAGEGVNVRVRRFEC